MKTINRKSIEIVNGSKRVEQRTFITVSDQSVFFTAAIARMCDLKAGDYIHFMNDGADWEFYVNDDPDGFRISYKQGYRTEVKITSQALCKMILKSFGHAAGKRFAVHGTGRFLDNNPIFKIDDDKVFPVKR